MNTVKAFTLLVTISSCIASYCATAQSQGLSEKTEFSNEFRKPLDLRPPDIRRLFEQRKIAEALSTVSFDNIEVIGAPVLLPQTDREMPEIWLGLPSFISAARHPTAAWRILAPVTPNIATRLSTAPDLTYESLRLASR